MKKCIAVLCLPLFLFACTTYNDNSFLAGKLAPEVKSRAVTEQGIIAYKQHLDAENDYSKVEEVREYFEVALRYDPENTTALSYLSKVDAFKANFLHARIKTASALADKQGRSESDTYAMFIALQDAKKIDPSNATTKKLLKDNAKALDSLVASYLDRSRKVEDRITKKTPQDTSDGLYAEAYLYARKASLVDPDSGEAAGRKKALYSSLSDIFENYQGDVDKAITGGYFSKARATIAKMAALNKQAQGDFDDPLHESVYHLNFEWAKYFEAKGDYPQALTKLDIAIDSIEKSEALELRKKLSDRTEAIESVTSFDAAIPVIDGHISRGELVSASRKLDKITPMASDQSRKDMISDRRDRIHNALKDVYDKALAAYRAEDFQKAIQFLTTVARIDAEYEQTADYLAKAREKQKLIEQFQ